MAKAKAETEEKAPEMPPQDQNELIQVLLKKVESLESRVEQGGRPRVPKGEGPRKFDRNRVEAFLEWKPPVLDDKELHYIYYTDNVHSSIFLHPDKRVANTDTDLPPDMIQTFELDWDPWDLFGSEFMVVDSTTGAQGRRPNLGFFDISRHHLVKVTTEDIKKYGMPESTKTRPGLQFRGKPFYTVDKVAKMIEARPQFGTTALMDGTMFRSWLRLKYQALWQDEANRKMVDEAFSKFRDGAHKRGALSDAEVMEGVA